MFLVLGGMIVSEETGKVEGDIASAEASLAIIGLFFAIMSLGVWYVFRKRGRIYI